MFRKILIANRGEIALRIIRTCKRLGVKTVAVYSNADLESRHVISSDEAYEIGAGPPSDSYLNIPKIIKAAKESRAEAVHPGYGFLAENPDLARACEESDLVFIGPSSRVLAQVANKLESKKFAEKAGVPVIPGAATEILSLALKVVQATHYENAGTVEFVLSKEEEFYYLETNKRIQVEHLISEIVTGVDIVENQLLIASEHRLNLSQDEISFTGAALNCR